MKCAFAVCRAGQWNPATAVDRVVLDSDARHCRRTVLTGENGLKFLLDLAQAMVLRDGDGLVLDDGAIVRVAGAPEPLVEITAGDARDLARLSWHIGNRHTDVQIVGGRLRIRRDHVLEEMVASLGARLEAIEAVFDPEPGVAVHAQGHEHGG